MRILIAPDKFKGSLTAKEAADAIARGIAKAWPGSVLDLAPIADGGEGFAESFLASGTQSRWETVRVHDPIGRPVDARYLWITGSATAVIGMSEASGLWRLAPDERQPLLASTYGTGQLMAHAIGIGARKILLGLGGSATTDGGIGMAAALRYRFLDASGHELEPIPKNLQSIAAIDTSTAIPLPEIIAACDVDNPLLGANGTVNVFSAQKGATIADQEILERGLENLVTVLKRDLASSHHLRPGAGAAGGLGFGLMTFCAATVKSGFALVAETIGLEQRIAAADLVITGEGRLDSQTAHGKGPAGVAALAKKSGKPLVAFAGSVSEDVRPGALFDAIVPILQGPMTLEESMQRGAELLEEAAAGLPTIFATTLKTRKHL